MNPPPSLGRGNSNPRYSCPAVHQQTAGSQPFSWNSPVGRPAFFFIVRCDDPGAARAPPFDSDRAHYGIWRAGRPRGARVALKPRPEEAFVRFMSVGEFSFPPLFLASLSFSSP